MTRYAVQRILYTMFVIFGVVTVVFFIVRVVPGDPAALLLGTEATEASVAELRRSLGLDRGLLTQYCIFLGSVARGDLGRSLFMQEPALPIVLERLPATLLLSFSALALVVCLSFPLGVLAALRVNSRYDRLIGAITLSAQGFPNYWVGLVFILIFARTLRWLPTSGYGSLSHLVLPAATVAFPLVAFLTRLVRTGMLETLSQDYIRTARAKGMREIRVLTKHAFRNFLIPIVTVLGLHLGNLLMGAVVVEKVFGWPGVGNLIVQAIELRDYPVVQASVIVVATFFVLVNLVVDLLYSYIDPRIRFE